MYTETRLVIANSKLAGTFFISAALSPTGKNLNNIIFPRNSEIKSLQNKITQLYKA